MMNTGCTSGMLKLFALTLTFVLIAVPGIAGDAKVDSAIFILKRPGADLTAARAKKIVKSVLGSAETFVSTIVRFKGDLSEVKSEGGRVRSIIGDIATVDMPLSAVDRIAALRGVVHISAAQKMKPLLDASVPATQADTLRSGAAPDWTGNTGRNVIIGIVDTGIDLAHGDFKNGSGKTRVLSLWDQSAASGTAPAGYSYGNECSQTDIDAGNCSQADTEGHGTHVAGIAAGNGSATGNGQTAYTYMGMAPEADLVIVHTDFTSTGILDGVAYIQAKAAALGKPSVINLSLGSQYDPHDGTSDYAQGLNNASGAARVIVNAAGNSADADIHASGAVSQGSTKSVSFTIPSGTSLEALDLWYAGADQMDVMVSKGTCSTSYVSPDDTEHDFDTSCGGIAIISSSRNPNNGDREIVAYLYDQTYGASHSLSSGGWSITLKGTSISSGGKYDVWAAAEAAQFSTADPSITVCDGGTAAKVITVGSFNTKNSWTAVDGNIYQLNPSAAGDTTLGEISSFSSLGPRRACSATANCPSLQKPDITAPGMAIFSAYSADTYPAPDSAYIAPDGVHRMNAGTSMAAPHVTGAVALLLQADPSLTSDDVKTLLTSNISSDSYTGTLLPDDAWGYGKLNAAAAFAATPNDEPTAPTDLTATAQELSATLTWSANTEPDLEGYNLYRSSASGSGYAKVNTNLISYKNAAYTDAGLSAGMTYYYTLKAVDTAGQESTASEEASATIEASGANGTNGSGADGGKKCFIATAAYGSYLDPHVTALRKFRDEALLSTSMGRLAVDAYYAASPPLAGIIAGSPVLRSATRMALTPLVLGVEYPGAVLLMFSLFLPAGCAAVVLRRRIKHGNG